VGEDENEGWWFSDGYADYVRHFMAAMGAVPEWAPLHQAHILRSTSMVKSVSYESGRVAWTTFDTDSTETLRLPGRPTAVSAGSAALPERSDGSTTGYSVRVLASGDRLVQVHHAGSGEVAVVF
jgi:hypothetical protein